MVGTTWDWACGCAKAALTETGKGCVTGGCGGPCEMEGGDAENGANSGMTNARCMSKKNRCRPKKKCGVVRYDDKWCGLRLICIET